MNKNQLNIFHYLMTECAFSIEAAQAFTTENAELKPGSEEFMKEVEGFCIKWNGSDDDQ